MNTRQPIQPSNTPIVYSLSFSNSKNRFIAGLSSGICLWRTDNCLETYRPNLPPGCHVLIAEALDDRYSAFVAKNRASNSGGPNVVVFWDAVLGRELRRLDFYEPVLGLRLTSKWLAVVLLDRTILFEYQQMPSESLPTPSMDDAHGMAADEENHGHEEIRAPNRAVSIHSTSSNPFALICLSEDLLVLPAMATGQAHLITLKAGSTSSKRVIRAHNSSLRCMAICQDGSLFATASQQGTLVRIFDTRSQSKLFEFRRGLDHAIIHNLAFSPGKRFVASTSDKGTLHIFDLQPPSREQVAAAAWERDQEARKQRKQHGPHRLSGGIGNDKESMSEMGSSPAPSTAIGPGIGGNHGSVQEYYGLRPPPSNVTPPARDAAVSLMAAFKSSPLTPQAMRDVRSAASTPFYTGNDSPHWQGGPPHSWTTAPNGARKRVKNPVLPLPNDPNGRPPKGILTFAPAERNHDDDNGATIYVVGGGSDARWEMFDLIPTADGGWTLSKRGFRKYLTRQFAD